MEHTPVLIVGGGPVGLALSIDLSWRGVRHVLIERDLRSARASFPRMDQVGIRTMEHMRRLGVEKEIEEAGFPRDFPRDVIFETAILGYELARDPVECDATRPPPPFSPQKHELCPQTFFDPALQRIAERSGYAAIRYGHRLLSLDDEGDGVRCRVTDGEHERIIFARYVAGCDGSGSTVAAQLGIGASAASTLACSTNIFIESPALGERTAGRRAYRHILFGPEGVWGSMVNIDGRDLWRLQVLGDTVRQTWSEADAAQAIDRAIGTKVPYRIEAIIPWMRRELVVDRFRSGNCFLVGDAAHQFSPTGGYGMNTGLSEAFNLSWKLAAMEAGWGGPRLLDSYEIERRPIALRNAAQATANFHTMRATPGDPAVMEDNPAGDAARTRIGTHLLAAMHDEWDSMGIHLGPSYSGSPIVHADSEPSPEDRPASYQACARAGHRAPHAPLGEWSTLDLFGDGFTLLDFSPKKVGAHSLVEAARRHRMPLYVEHIGLPAVAKLYGQRFVLVRPDGHVCWRGDQLPPDPEALIDLVRGAAGDTSLVLDQNLEASVQ